MKVLYILLSLIVVTIILCLIPMFGTKEGYSNVGYVPNPNPSRSDYIEIGKKKYNPLADPTDVLGPGLFGAAMTNADRMLMNNKVQDATETVTLKQTETNRMTFMDPTVVSAKVAVPPQNEIVEKIRKCESRKTRDSCAILDDPEYKECGVCIVDGTGILENTDGGHIGGLYMTEKDRQRALQFNGKDGKRYVAQYHQPSQGKCLPNNFFINKADCIRASNIQNCKEIGDSGRGFFAARTVENKTAAQTECAQCGDNKNAYVYQPRANNTSMIRLRAIAPIGTGMTQVRVFRKGGGLLGEGSQSNSREFVINLSDAIRENEELEIFVVQEFPYRSATGGMKEVFYMDKGATKISSAITEARRSQGLDPFAEGYTTKTEAAEACARINCELATLAQLRDANSKGLQTCNFGWLKDEAVPYKSAKASIAKSSSSTCEAIEGVTSNDEPLSAGAWCFGVKPESGRYQYTESNNTLYDTEIAPFFKSFGADSVPPQGNRPTRNSQHAVVDRDYVAPNYRAVILQWEATDSDDNVMNMVRFPIRPTITQINNQNVNAETGTELSVLRQYGTFRLSRIILEPRPNAASIIDNDAAWFWSMANVSNSIKVTAKVPGLLKRPFYSEEQQKCAGKPIVTKQETLDTLRISACDTNPSNQGPGTYTVDCLKELFENAGGNLYEGRLSPLRSDANIRTLLKVGNIHNRHKESIISFLSDKYLIATTGRNNAGALAGGTNPADQKAAINNAAMDLFGFEIVSPCEDIVVNEQGLVLVSTKKGPFNEECLDLLYRNAGYETDRVQERLKNNRKVLKPTYQTIGDKFSGLMSKDLASKEDKKQFPFRTCSDKGLINPTHADDEVRKNAIIAANEAGNTIDDIQAFYNTIYMNANKSYQGVRPEDAYTQKEYMEQCYGIKTMDNSAPENMACGVTARYIRILRSVLSGTEGNKPISLSQVVVLNASGLNIAKGKRVAFRSVKPGAAAFKIVDGINVDTVRTDLRNMYVDNGGSEAEANASIQGQFVQIDLGNPEEVRTVRVVHGGTQQTLENTVGLVVQLLNADGKVVTQKVLEKSTIDDSMIGVLTFRKDDVMDEVPANSVAISLQADLFNLQFTRNALGRLDFNIGTVVFDKQTADTSGFMIINQNNQYLGCSRTGDVAEWVPANQRGNYYTEFFIVPAINGAMGAISIEMARAPGRYLVKDYTGASFGKFVNVTNASSNWSKARASMWRLRKPNSTLVLG